MRSNTSSDQFWVQAKYVELVYAFSQFQAKKE